jgi:hypothetical protein
MLYLCGMDGGLYHALIGRGTARNIQRTVNATNVGGRYRISIGMLTVPPVARRWTKENKMDKYIHIEDLKDYLNRQIQAFEPCPDKYDAAVGIYNGLYQIPAADVVPVVRCRECRFNTTEKKCLNPDSIIKIPNDNDFCSYGKRRI